MKRFTTWLDRYSVKIFIISSVLAIILVILDVILQAKGKGVDFSEIYIFFGGTMLLTVWKMISGGRK